MTLFLALLQPVSTQATTPKNTKISPIADNQLEIEDQDDMQDEVGEQIHEEKLIIENIVIHGLTLLPEDTIFSSLPFSIGDVFDKNITSTLIKKVESFDLFSQVKVATEQLGKNRINLHILLTEKTPLSEVIFKGNKHLKDKDIYKKTDLEKKKACDAHELKKYIKIIKKLYADKNYHFAQVETELKKDDGKTIALFTITEGPRALIKKVRFKGNNLYTDKRIRSLLLTREDWIMGIMDRSGTYNPLMVEQDRMTIENFYQSNGYLNAKVYDVKVDFDEKKESITLTFCIDEGDKYTISSVNAPGNDLLTEEQLLATIPIRAEQPYSRELIRFSIERLRDTWGRLGFIYADIEPAIQPDEDTKTVALTFYSDPGNKMFLNTINIFGNEKTRDKIIRRQLVLEDGELLTTDKMEESKNRVSQLGYFDPRDGVNWKTTRLDDETIDLDLLVKEVSTGRFNLQANYGGTPGQLSTSGSSFSVETSMTERNLYGLGLVAQIMGRLGRDERSAMISFSEPWLWDKPIRIGLDAFFSHSTYDEIRKIDKTILEKRVGASVNFGFVSRTLNDIGCLFELGFERINHGDKNLPTASVNTTLNAQQEYQAILDERFKGGAYTFLQTSIGKDTRNHPVHISRGYKWNAISRLGIPSFHDTVGFHKFSIDGHWYTPIINETTLVLHLHGHFGLVTEIGSNRIPYRELYHIGGQASVRGWKFGQISPMWFVDDLVEESGWQGDSIGAKKGLFWNLELVFPFVEDMSMKGTIFYDGGSGWDTPNPSMIDTTRLKNNSFDYRHAIGIGIRLLNPQPIRVDWGFKLDKRTGESLHEVHFATYFDF